MSLGKGQPTVSTLLAFSPTMRPGALEGDAAILALNGGRSVAHLLGTQRRPRISCPVRCLPEGGSQGQGLQMLRGAHLPCLAPYFKKWQQAEVPPDCNPC